MCIRSALETSQTCGGLEGMESKWPGKRIQADLPFMAHMLYNHCESGFKTGNKPDDLAAPPSRASSRDHGAALSTRPGCVRPAAAARDLLRTASRCPGRPLSAVGTDCRVRRLRPRSTASRYGTPYRKGATGPGHPDRRRDPNRPGRVRRDCNFNGVTSDTGGDTR